MWYNIDYQTISEEVIFLEGKRCCFTGHRPEKLHMSERAVRQLLRREIKKAVEDGFLTFITGMARGIDMWAGDIVLSMRKHNPDIRLICIPPYEGFESRWAAPEQKRYNEILKKADYTKFICEHYSRSCFQIRNVYMVDHSSRVIAAYNGERGGTKNTIDYATRKGIEVVNIFKRSADDV